MDQRRDDESIYHWSERVFEAEVREQRKKWCERHNLACGRCNEEVCEMSISYRRAHPLDDGAADVQSCF